MLCLKKLVLNWKHSWFWYQWVAGQSDYGDHRFCQDPTTIKLANTEQQTIFLSFYICLSFYVYFWQFIVSSRVFFLFFVPVQPKQSLFEMWCLKVETREFWWDKIPLLGKCFLKFERYLPIYLDCLSVRQTTPNCQLYF